MSYVRDYRKEGRGWVAVVTDPKAKSGRVSKTFATQKEAKAYIAKQETRKNDGEYITPAAGEVVFRERYDKWVKAAVNVRESTRETEGYFARSLILPSFGDRPIAEIELEEIQDWVEELIEANYAPSTIQKAHHVLSKVLSHSVQNKVLRGNPASGVMLPRVEVQEQRFLDVEQVYKLADVIDERYRLWLLMSAFAGTRAEESFGLRAGRIDRLRPELDIVETIVETKKGMQWDQPKTKYGKRRIDLPPMIWEDLVRSAETLDPSALLFPGNNGTDPVRLRNFRRRVWYKATVAAGLGEMIECARLRGEECIHCLHKQSDKPAREGHYVGLRIHDLRHTAVSLWIHLGSDPLTVSRRAGHSKVAFTLDRYGHRFPRETDPAIDKLNALLRAQVGDNITPLHAVS